MPSPRENVHQQETLEDEASLRELHERSIIVNALDSTHIDQGDDLYIQKLKHSGVTAINHTVAATEDTIGAMRSIVDWWRVYARYPDDIIVGKTFDDIARAKNEGKVAIFFGFQGTDAMGEHLYLYEIFHALGVRFVQLTYQLRNLVGDGCGEPANAGLSRYGKDVVRELNRLGVVIDLSHVGVRSTLEAIELSRDPVMISHSAARTLCDTVRNKTDEEIKALAARGGVIGIPPKSGFLSATGLKRGASIDDYIDHIDYIVDLVGIDHVGVGTDVGDERKYTPEGLLQFHKLYPEVAIIDGDFRTDRMHATGLQSPADLGNLTVALGRRGYGGEDIVKIMGGNFTRLFSRVWTEGSDRPKG